MDSNAVEPESNSMEFVLKRSLLSKNKLAVILKEDGVTKYCCVECSACYDDKEKLEIHLCTHFKEFRFLCGICGTGLKRKEHLDRHTLGHQEVRPHICSECGKGFKRKEHLNIHSSIHSGDKSQICPLCNRSFYRKDHLQKHLQTHNKLFMEQNIYPVSDQELMEIKQEMLDVEDVKPLINGLENVVEEFMEIQDVSREPSDPDRPYECCVCHKTYKRKDHLKLHSYTHLKKDKVCSECGKGFHREEQLLTHMNLHVNQLGVSDSEQGPVPLQQPGIRILPLPKESLLVERVAGGKIDRPHECPVCHRKFKRKQHLKVHANVHLKLQQPTIWCSLCNEGFVTNDQFESHHCMVVDHYNGGQFVDADEQGTAATCDAKKENDYPPEFIDVSQEFLSPQQQVVMSEEKHLPTPQRVYVCKYCCKPFKRKDHYKIHLHIHTGIKSFFCPDCGKGFYRKDHLQKHATVHQRIKQTKTKKSLPGLFPISMRPKKDDVLPEITITAPSNTKLRVPLQIKVPYQMVVSMDNGEQRAVTIDPHTSVQ